MIPRIGIVASAHRPQNWMDLYKSIGDNDIEFELVFVGPNQPDYELPKNFHFIRSLVKPTQCFEIACRNTTADLVMFMTDDCEFKGTRPLDRLNETFKTYKNEKLLLSCRLSTNDIDESHYAHRFYIEDPSSPILSVGGLMSKKFFSDLGGIDRNFIAVMWDLDLGMRVYASGGDVLLSDVFLNEDKKKSAGSLLCNEFWRHDRGLLESLWTKNGKVHFRRTKPFEPFDNLNILSVSQGPRGRWRGNGPVIIEKIVDRLNINRRLVKYGPLVRAACQAIGKPAMYPKYTKKLLSRLIRCIY